MALIYLQLALHNVGYRKFSFRARLMSIASHSSGHGLLKTDDKLTGGYTLLELVEAALQTFQPLSNNSSLGHWLKASVLERLWQVVLIHRFRDLGVPNGRGEDCDHCQPWQI